MVKEIQSLIASETWEKPCVREHILFFTCWDVGIELFFTFCFSSWFLRCHIFGHCWKSLFGMFWNAQQFTQGAIIQWIVLQNLIFVISFIIGILHVCCPCRLLAFKEWSKKFKYLFSRQCTDLSLGVSSGSHFVSLWQFYLLYFSWQEVLLGHIMIPLCVTLSS